MPMKKNTLTKLKTLLQKGVDEHFWVSVYYGYDSFYLEPYDKTYHGILYDSENAVSASLWEDDYDTLKINMLNSPFYFASFKNNRCSVSDMYATLKKLYIKINTHCLEKGISKAARVSGFRPEISDLINNFYFVEDIEIELSRHIGCRFSTKADKTSVEDEERLSEYLRSFSKTNSLARMKDTLDALFTTIEQTQFGKPFKKPRVEETRWKDAAGKFINLSLTDYSVEELDYLNTILNEVGFYDLLKANYICPMLKRNGYSYHATLYIFNELKKHNPSVKNIAICPFRFTSSTFDRWFSNAFRYLIHNKTAVPVKKRKTPVRKARVCNKDRLAPVLVNNQLYTTIREAAVKVGVGADNLWRALEAEKTTLNGHTIARVTDTTLAKAIIDCVKATPKKVARYTVLVDGVDCGTPAETCKKFNWNPRTLYATLWDGKRLMNGHKVEKAPVKAGGSNEKVI